MSDDLNKRVQVAVKHFWRTRSKQSKSQGGSGENTRDRGARSAVTGGRQLDGFVDLIRDLLVEEGIPKESIHCDTSLQLPGWFRAEKEWDLVVIQNGHLLAAIEFKSQVGPSFGNNFNNRTEESLGNATDIWAAVREGAFRPSLRPWLGYLMLVEDCERSRSPVSVKQPHFQVFSEFSRTSYIQRYNILLQKLVRERLYDGATLLLSKSTAAKDGVFTEPDPELSVQNFVSSLLACTRAASLRA